LLARAQAQFEVVSNRDDARSAGARCLRKGQQGGSEPKSEAMRPRFFSVPRRTYRAASPPQGAIALRYGLGTNSETVCRPEGAMIKFLAATSVGESCRASASSSAPSPVS
jgi:hypothetical protein